MRVYKTTDSRAEPQHVVFNCTVRNTEELALERIELHLGEELRSFQEGGELPLIRIDEHGAWAWMPQQNLWWPLRNASLKIGLDRNGGVRLKWDA